MGQALVCTCGGREIQMMGAKSSKATASLEPSNETAGPTDQPPQAPVKSSDVTQDEVKESTGQVISQLSNNEKYDYLVYVRTSMKSCNLPTQIHGGSETIIP